MIFPILIYLTVFKSVYLFRKYLKRGWVHSKIMLRILRATLNIVIKSIKMNNLSCPFKKVFTP